MYSFETSLGHLWCIFGVNFQHLLGHFWNIFGTSSGQFSKIFLDVRRPRDAAKRLRRGPFFVVRPRRRAKKKDPWSEDFSRTDFEDTMFTNSMEVRCVSKAWPKPSAVDIRMRSRSNSKGPPYCRSAAFSINFYISRCQIYIR